MRGIAPDDAAAAAENARSKQSRWWLKGNDPEHPSLREEGAHAVAGASLVADDDERSHPSVQANPNPELVQSNGDASTDDEDGSDAADAQDDQDDDDLLEDANVPILARDDDLGTSFGTLSSFCDGRLAARFGGAANSGGHAAASHLHSLPSWLSPQTSPAEVSPEACKPAVANCEEVINSYAAYPDLTKETQLEVPSQPLAAAVQVTSESEADDSISSGRRGYEFRIARRPSNVVGVEGRSKKRVRRGSSTLLDEAYLEARVENAKAELLSRLATSEGISPAFRAALANLEKYSKLLRSPANKKRKLSTSCAHATESADIDGTWQMISPPEYPSCLGTNAAGERLFTLGRMSFDMYQPSDVVCSIQHQFNTVKAVEAKDLPRYVPKSLRNEVDEERDGCSGRLKTIIASFTIEDKRKKPLRGILTNYGYSLPDPTHPNRKSIWFSGGTIEPADDDSLDDWMKVFGSSAEVDRATGNAAIDAEKARSLASKIFLGAVPEPIDEDGVVGYHLHRPIGGHGAAYVDLVYMDDELRIMRGHSGSVYVFKRA
ncbi:hypothetical protein ACHAXT_005493 [Thalassiosira profunda]